MASDSTFRLFVAVYPPVETARRLLDLVKELPALNDGPKFRLTPDRQVHLTLQFIGDRSSHELDEVTESVERSAAGLEAFELEPLKLITLPERGHARLVACETTAPGVLMEIHRRLAHRLARNPRERCGDRFYPHLTLARFGTPAKLRFDEPIGDGAGIGSFRVDAVSLMRSILKPSGAEHVEVSRFSLR